MEADIRIFDEVDSTNTTLEQLAASNDREGLCVVSLLQRKGQGRSGRSFYSPEGGNLYMSLLIKPVSPDVVDILTPAAAVAVVRVIAKRFGINTGIKWVNDIMYRGRKVCGIIAKAYDYGMPGRYVILGIGINIYRSSDIPEDILDVYGSLYDKSCTMSKDMQRVEAVETAAAVIKELSHLLYETDRKTLFDEYRDRSVVIGKEVEYLSGSLIKHAKVEGIDDNGAIILSMDGNTGTYRDGEIRIRLSDM